MQSLLAWIEPISAYSLSTMLASMTAVHLKLREVNDSDEHRPADTHVEVRSSRRCNGAEAKGRAVSPSRAIAWTPERKKSTSAIGSASPESVFLASGRPALSICDLPRATEDGVCEIDRRTDEENRVLTRIVDVYSIVCSEQGGHWPSIPRRQSHAFPPRCPSVQRQAEGAKAETTASRRPPRTSPSHHQSSSRGGRATRARALASLSFSLPSPSRPPPSGALLQLDEAPCPRR